MQQSDSNLTRYKAWFTANGGFMDSGLKIDTLNGFRGLFTTKEIPANKAIIAIPNKIVISTKLALQSDLKEFFKKYPELYDGNINVEHEYNVLAAFVSFEKLKGEASFFHPFLSATPYCETICEWTRSDLEALKDPFMLTNGQNFQRLMDENWEDFQKKAAKYSKQFKGLTKEIYYWAYQYVMTRIFTWGQPCGVLLPIAELQNHTQSQSQATDHILVNRHFEEMPKLAYDYKLKNQKIDLSIIRTLGVESRPADFQDQRQKYIDDNKQYFDESTGLSLKEMIEEINYQRAKQENTNIFTYDYYSSDDEEDNDSDKDMYEQEDQFTWYENEYDETYFTVVTRKKYVPGEQIFCSYGIRSSRFLLKWYGFVEQHSKNDSVQIQMYLNQRKIVDQKSANEAVCLEDLENQLALSNRYRFKLNHLCEDLLIYLRQLVAEEQGVKLSMFSIPTSLKAEIEVFRKYALILNTFIHDEISEEELQSLQKQASTGGRQGTIAQYRLNRHRIINKQRQLCQLTQSMLDEFQVNGKIQLTREVVQLRHYIQQLNLGIQTK